MKRRNFLKVMTTIPVIGFIPALFAKPDFSKYKVVEESLGAEVEEGLFNSDYLTDPDKWYLKEDIVYKDQKQGQTLTYPRGHPKTCSELVEWMEKTLPVGESTINQYSVTGEKYIEYINGIKKVTFDKNNTGGETKEELLCRSAWRYFLNECRQCNSPTLYWRRKPEYDEYHIYDQRLYKIGLGIDPESNPRTSRIYMRYLVSDKVQYPDLHEDYIKQNPEYARMINGT